MYKLSHTYRHVETHPVCQDTNPTVSHKQWASYQPARSWNKKSRGFIRPSCPYGWICPSSPRWQVYKWARVAELIEVWTQTWTWIHPVPNGASLRGNTSMMHRIANNFISQNTVIYEIPARKSLRSPQVLFSLTNYHIECPLPKELVLIHERTDHYSLQSSIPMSLPGSCHSLSQPSLFLTPPKSRTELPGY